MYLPRVTEALHNNDTTSSKISEVLIMNGYGMTSLHRPFLCLTQNSLAFGQ